MRALAEPDFGTATIEDDLPRTFRREREAREREQREREAREREQREHQARAEEALSLREYLERTPGSGAYAHGGAMAIERLDMPFLHLVRFFLKAVFAAIPALILLSALLWMGGQALSIAFPHLSKMQILIHVPQ